MSLNAFASDTLTVPFDGSEVTLDDGSLGGSTLYAPASGGHAKKALLTIPATGFSAKEIKFTLDNTSPAATTFILKRNVELWLNNITDIENFRCEIATSGGGTGAEVAITYFR